MYLQAACVPSAIVVNRWKCRATRLRDTSICCWWGCPNTHSTASQSILQKGRTGKPACKTAQSNNRHANSVECTSPTLYSRHCGPEARIEKKTIWSYIIPRWGLSRSCWLEGPRELSQIQGRKCWRLDSKCLWPWVQREPVTEKYRIRKDGRKHSPACMTGIVLPRTRVLHSKFVCRIAIAAVYLALSCAQRLTRTRASFKRTMQACDLLLAEVHAGILAEIHSCKKNARIWTSERQLQAQSFQSPQFTNHLNTDICLLQQTLTNGEQQ